MGRFVWPCRRSLRGSVSLVRLTARSVFATLIHILCARQVVIVEVATTLPFLRPVLFGLEEFLIKFPNVHQVTDLAPRNMQDLFGFWPLWYPDMFIRVEPVHDCLWDLADADQIFMTRHESRAYLHESCIHTDRTLNSIILLLHALDGFGINYRDGKLLGFNREVAVFYSAYFGQLFPFPTESLVQPSRPLNIALLLGAAFANLIWVMFSTRWFGSITARRRFDFGTDIVNGDRRHLELMKKVCPDPRQLLFVFRNKYEFSAARTWNELSDVNIAVRGDGFLTPGQGLNAVSSLFFTVLKIWPRLLARPSELFIEITKFPIRYWQFVALLNLYEFKAFYGKDDYNSSHVLRTGAFREAGVVCIGGQHGLPVPEGLSPFYRYLDFDHYFMFGMHLYEAYYRDRWPSDMKIEAIGSYSFPSELEKNIERARGPDIVMFLTVLPEMEKIMDLVVELARRFPERTVYVRQKRRLDNTQFEGHENPDFSLAALGYKSAIPHNVVDTSENSYKLMLKGSYAFCTRSTTIAVEAIQSGLTTFIMDPLGGGGSGGYWQNWPELLVSDVGEAERRIRELEAGTYPYPWRRVSRLTVRGSKDIANTIRLAAKISLDDSVLALTHQTSEMDIV